MWFRIVILNDCCYFNIAWTEVSYTILEKFSVTVIGFSIDKLVISQSLIAECPNYLSVVTGFLDITTWYCRWILFLFLFNIFSNRYWTCQFVFIQLHLIYKFHSYLWKNFNTSSIYSKAEHLPDYQLQVLKQLILITFDFILIIYFIIFCYISYVFLSLAK